MPLKLLKKLAAGLQRGKPTGICWTAPSLLDVGHVKGIHFGMDRNGRGLSIWENARKIWVKPGGPAYLDEESSLSLGEGMEPLIAANLEGRGAAIWCLDGIFERAIIGLPFNPSADRAPSPKPIFKTTGIIRNLQVAVDRRGSAMIAWSHELEGKWEVLAKVFDVRAQAWDQEPKRLGSIVDYPLVPRLAMNRKGSAMVVWQEQSRDADKLVASFYLPAEKIWSDHPVDVAPGKAKEFQVAMDHSGNAMVLWVLQEYRERALLQGKLFSASNAGWGQVDVLSRARSFDHLQLAMTGTGEALAVWLQTEESRDIFLHSKAFHAKAWDADVTRLDSEGGRVGAFTMALGAKGQAGLFYFQQDANGFVPFIRTRNRNWGQPMQIANRSEKVPSHPSLGLCPEGIVAHWMVGPEGKAEIFMVGAATPTPKVVQPQGS